MDLEKALDKASFLWL